MSTSNSSKDSISKYSVKKGGMSNQYKRISLEKLAQSNEGVYKNARYMNICLILMGCPVNLKCKSGDTFHGIFTTFSPEFEVVLECCHKVDAKNEVVICGRSLPNKTNEVRTLIFPKEDIVEIVAVEVDKEFAITSLEPGFTDSAIAQKINGLKGQNDCKALEPFAFGEIEDNAEIDLEGTKGWSVDDMLSTNEAKYGYKSTYKSDLSEYTVAVEKEDTEDYRKREEEAERIAIEIESSSTYKNNVDKELSDNEEEEAAFSAVDRSAAADNNDNEDLTSGYNSYNSSKDKFINTNNKRNRGFDQRNKQRNSSSNLQNQNPGMSNNSNSTNSYKRYPSNGNNMNNSYQSKSTFERANSNIDTSNQNTRQFYSQNSNNTIDSQVYHNRRSKINNNNNNNSMNTNDYNRTTNDTNKKNYRNSPQQKAQEQQNYDSNSNLSETQIDAAADEEQKVATTLDSVNTSSKKGLKSSSPISQSKSQDESTSNSKENTSINNNSPIVKTNINDNQMEDSNLSNTTSTTTTTNNDDSTNAQNTSKNSDAPKYKLNPFAQEFNPLNTSRAQMLSPLPPNVYVPINQPIVNSYPPPPNMHLQQQPLATQIYVNPNSQPVYIINQPYPPAYIQSPAPAMMNPQPQQQQQPPPQQQAQNQKPKKGNNEQHVNQQVMTAIPAQHQMPPQNQRIAYQPGVQQQYTTVPPSQQQQHQQLQNNQTIVTYQIQQQQPPQQPDQQNPHQVHAIPVQNQRMSYQPGQPQFTTMIQQQPPNQIIYQQQASNDGHQMNVQQMQPHQVHQMPPQMQPNQRIIQYDPNTQYITTAQPQQIQGGPYAPNQVIYAAQPPMNYPNPNGQMAIRYIQPNPQMISYQQQQQQNPNEQQQIPYPNVVFNYIN